MTDMRMWIRRRSRRCVDRLSLRRHRSGGASGALRGAPGRLLRRVPRRSSRRCRRCAPSWRDGRRRSRTIVQRHRRSATAVGSSRQSGRSSGGARSRRGRRSRRRCCSSACRPALRTLDVRYDASGLRFACAPAGSKAPQRGSAGDRMARVDRRTEPPCRGAPISSALEQPAAERQLRATGDARVADARRRRRRRRCRDSAASARAR